MAGTQDNRPGEEEEEEEEVDDAVSSLTRIQSSAYLIVHTGIQDDEGCGPLRH